MADRGVSHKHGLSLAGTNNSDALANVGSQRIRRSGLDGFFPGKYLAREVLFGVVEIDSDGGLWRNFLLAWVLAGLFKIGFELLGRPDEGVYRTVFRPTFFLPPFLFLPFFRRAFFSDGGAVLRLSMAAAGIGGIRPLAAAVRSLVAALDSLTKTQSENLISPMLYLLICRSKLAMQTNISSSSLSISPSISTTISGLFLSLCLRIFALIDISAIMPMITDLFTY
jgi:hypothetical protein